MLKRRLWIAVTLCGLIAPNAQAAMAVVDVAAIAKLASQLQTLQAQLEQAQTAYQSMTGPRGMDRLLTGTVRNYLPPDWAALEAAVRQASGAYRALASQINSTMIANAVLTPQQVARLSTEERDQLQAARRSAAMLQVTTRQALETTSSRFDSIQQLIGAIGTAEDPKAVMDLQARIAAEQAMLQNEHTKLQLLFQAAQAEEWARKQQAREHAIVAIGSLRNLPPLSLTP